jgi:hypothetical protein
MTIDHTRDEDSWSQACMGQLMDALTEGTASTPYRDSEYRDSEYRDSEYRDSEYRDSEPLRWILPPSHEAILLLADRVLKKDLDFAALRTNPRARGVLEQGLRSLASWLVDGVQKIGTEESDPQRVRLFQAAAAQRGGMLYQRFRELQLRHTEGPLLRTLLANPIPSAMALGVDLLVESPPHAWQDSSLAISTLVQTFPWDVAIVFPRLLESTDPAVLAPALDLANLLFLQRGVTPHPGKERFEMLLALLGGVVSRLELMEEDPQHFSTSVSEIQRILFDSISLTISLCHTMALLGDSRAIGKLNQAMDLGHRRIRAEAAFALAKLGEASAVDCLLELALDDATRPRVLHYVRELGFADRIEPEWESDEARARSMLALQLSQPEWFAVAPQRIELVDRREIAIPGLQGPQPCFLFHYEYDFGLQRIANIGFSGPFVFLFSTCILDWDMEQIYEVVLQSLEA